MRATIRVIEALELVAWSAHRARSLPTVRSGPAKVYCASSASPAAAAAFRRGPSSRLIGPSVLGAATDIDTTCWGQALQRERTPRSHVGHPAKNGSLGLKLPLASSASGTLDDSTVP
jgi:hypothetical protein